MCNGYGCNHCEGGIWKLTTCAKKFVSGDIVEAVNLASMADKGFLPVQGAMMDQSSWFYDLWIAVGNEQNQINAERLEKLERI